MTNWRKRLIEDSLPLKEISEQSAREKSIRHGHISTLHIWWARRPLVACRAAIFAALVSAPKDEAERKELHDFLKELCTWEASNDIRIIEKARKYIRKYYPDEPPKVLDMFAGGGAIPLEALRLGCESYAIDLNPVAHLIELCTLVYPQKYGLGPDTEKKRKQGFEFGEQKCQLAEDVRKWGNWVLEKAKKEIGHLYPKVNGKTPVAYIWTRTVKCPNPACGAEVPLVRQTWLCKRKNKEVAFRLIPNKETKSFRIEIIEGKELNFDPTETFSDAGSIKCPFCDTGGATSYVREQGRAGKIGQMMVAVVETNGHGKNYKIPEKADIDAFKEAENLLSRLEKEQLSEGLSAVPDEKLPPKGTLGFRVQNYGLTKWRDLFAPRQLVVLVTFARLVREAYNLIIADCGDEGYAKAVTTYLGLAVDKTTDRNSSFCRWISQTQAIGYTFGRQALPMIWDFVEANVFGGTSGDWIESVSGIVEVIETSQIIGEATAKVSIGTATSLQCPESTFQAVVTDPPYYNAIAYADLSDFFYVWLKRTVRWLYPDVFRTPLTPKSSEIIQNPVRHSNNNEKAKIFFESEMFKALKEANRVLKTDGICVIVYAHKTTSAWETLINALLEAGFVLTGSWPLHTERPGRLRAQKSAALASSIFLACQKRPEDAPVGLYSRVIRELQESVNERLSFFWEQGIRGPDFFVSAIGPAVEVFGKYSQVVKGSGEQVSVAEMLNEVRRLVTDYALKQILRGSELGDVDGATRLYVLWRWAFGSGKVPFDDANQLCQALGVESTMLMSKGGLLKKEGDSVLLYGSAERLKQKKNLGVPDETGQIPILVDALHRSLSLSGKPLAEYLAELSPHIRSDIWQIAQSLFEVFAKHVLPDGDEEKKLLSSLLASKERTSKAAEESSGQQTIQQYIEFGGD